MQLSQKVKKVIVCLSESQRMCRTALPLVLSEKEKNNNVIVPTRNLVSSISSLWSDVSDKHKARGRNLTSGLHILYMLVVSHMIRTNISQILHVVTLLKIIVQKLLVSLSKYYKELANI